MNFTYLNGNGINAVFISKNVTNKLSSSIATISRKQNGVTLEHRRVEVKRTINLPIIVDGQTVGIEPLSVSLLTSGSTRPEAFSAIDKMVQDVLLFSRTNMYAQRQIGVSPRTHDFSEAETANFATLPTP